MGRPATSATTDTFPSRAQRVIRPCPPSCVAALGAHRALPR
jgi:hypothetical protein